MKLRVVGWTEWDGSEVPVGDITHAAYKAIVMDIREKGYDFTGYDHQEKRNCCPVLNDGMKRRFNQRGFGKVMAEAHGEDPENSYSNWAFNWRMGDEDDTSVMPPESLRFDPKTFVPEADLNECFVHEVSDEIFAEAEAASEDDEIKLDDVESLWLIDYDDRITLVAGEKRATYTVVGVDRRKDFDKEEWIRIMALRYKMSPEADAEADKFYASKRRVVALKLKKTV